MAATKRPRPSSKVRLSYLGIAVFLERCRFTQAKEISMTDPRNKAHDKKVQQAKKHHDEEIAPGADKTPQPGKKTHMEHHASDVAKVPDEAAPVPTSAKSLVPRS